MEIKDLQDSISKFVKRYDYEPLYMVTVNTNACFEVLINDKPLVSYFGTNIGGVSFHANKAILQSGKQEIKVIIYPRYTDKKTQAETLSDDVEFELIIAERAWIKGEGGLTEPKVVYKYNLTEEKENDLSFSKQTQFVKIGNFTAKVPYTLDGWAKSRNLTKFNQEELLKNVLAIYERHHSFYKNGDAENIDRVEFKRTLEGSQATYLSREEIYKKRENLNATFIKYDDFEMQPLENYEMQFFGNGRMVGLIRTDGKNRGESALRCEYTNDIGMRRISIFDLLLHIPEGSNELEVIR